MLGVEEIKNYWEDRATSDSSAQSTTQDVYLREIELRVLGERISKLAPASVADIGCGDGRTTIAIANNLPGIRFQGFDYSSTMVENARTNLARLKICNVAFDCHDIRNVLEERFEIIYTTRCLINLPDWELQRVALHNIWKSLTSGGYYLMIENFSEGQENFNRLRREFRLPEIAIRDHNFFFERDRLLSYLDGMFTLIEEINISSAYYLVSRIVYSRICADAGLQPDYFDAHHRYAANLPFTGEYGPVRLLVLQRN